MPKITSQQASELLGVHPDTLRRWEEEGKITPERTSGGHRRYDAAKLLGEEKESGKTICYDRVSTRPQKEDLQRQLIVLASDCESRDWDYKIIKDIGSGINQNKAGIEPLVKSVNDLVKANKIELKLIDIKGKIYD